MREQDHPVVDATICDPRERIETQAPSTSPSDGPRIGRFQVRARLGAGATGVVFLAYDEQLERETAIKLLHPAMSHEHGQLRLLREARALARLSHPNVVQVHEVGEHADSLFIAMEYVRGQTLRVYAISEPHDWRATLGVLIQCARGLEAAHRAGLVHRDFKPANVMLGVDGRVRVLDFGLVGSRDPDIDQAAPKRPTTELAVHDRLELTGTGAIVGTPAYMAPEQLQGDACSPRTDQFAFCIVAFELLCGRHPFTGDTLDEQLHSRLAPISVEHPELPPRVKLAISRGLSLDPHARWPSMTELIDLLEEVVVDHDLRAYLHEQQRRGGQGGDLGWAASPRPLTELYGREAELATLHRGFERVVQAQRPRALLLVSGEAGIGKSALMRQLCHSAARGGALLAITKFDQLQLDNPRSALLATCESLARAIATEHESVRAQRVVAVRAGLGPLLGVLTAQCPSLEAIVPRRVGDEGVLARQDGSALGDVEQLERLRLALQRFIAALARPVAPVVLVLDDLQWADATSLDTLMHLLGADEVRGLVVLAGVRTSEHTRVHERLRALSEQLPTDLAFEHIELAPLSPADIEALLIGGLGLRAPLAPRLAELTHRKTGGNPLFTQQLLADLFEEGLLSVDRSGVWSCELEHVGARPLAVDVVELLATRVAALPLTALRVLQLAACMGNRVELAVLADAAGLTPAQTLRVLWPAIAGGLIGVEGEPELESDPELLVRAQLAFRHDRIQQVALARLGELERAQTHLDIGRAMRARLELGRWEPRWFETADQLNLGRALIDDLDERRSLAELDRTAGARACEAGAYAAAVRYYEAATQLLGTDPSPDRARRFELDYQLARALILDGRFVPARALLGSLRSVAEGPHEQIRVHALALEQSMLASDYRAGYEACRAALALHDIELPGTDATAQVLLDVELERLELQLRALDLAALRAWPEFDDPWAATRLNILSRFSVLAYRSSRIRMMGWAVAKLTRAALTSRSPLVGYAYASYGFLLAGRGEFERARVFGELGLELARERGDSVLAARTLMVAYGLSGHYHTPLVEVADRLLAAHPESLDAGDVVHASDLLLFADYLRLTAGQPLARLCGEVETHLPFFRRLASTPLRFFYLPHVVFLLEALTGRSLADFDAGRFMAEFEAIPSATAWHLSARLELQVLLGERDDVDTILASVVVIERAMWGQMHVPEARFHASMALLDARRELSAEQRDVVDAQMEAWQAEQADLAAQCPDNFAPAYLLVEAERARSRGAALEHIIESYERALASASASGALHKEALACRCYAEFWLARGNHRIGRMQLQAAIELYRRWGATRVAEQLAARYVELG